MRRTPHLLALLLVIQAFNGVDGLALGVALQSIKLDLHLSDTQLGFLTGLAFALFYSVMGIPLARWADRGDRRLIISLTTAIWSIMVALCAAASSFGQLLLIRIGVAIGEAGCIPPAHSLLADYYGRGDRPRAVANYMLAGALSTLIGYFGAGWLNQLLGWRWMFFLIGLPGLIPAAIAYFVLWEPRLDAARRRPSRSRSLASGSTTAERQPGLMTSLFKLWRVRSFRWLLLSFAVMSFFNSGILQWQPAYFTRTYGLGSGELGTWFATIYGLASLAGTFMGGELATRFAGGNEPLQLRAIALVFGSTAFFAAAMYLVRDRQLAFLMLGLSVLGGCLANGPLFAAIQSLIDERSRALSIAAIYFFSNLIGTGLGPLAVGIVSDVLQHRGVHDALRYSLLGLCPGYLLVGWLLWRSARYACADLGAADPDADVGGAGHAPGDRAASPPTILVSAEASE